MQIYVSVFAASQCKSMFLCLQLHNANLCFCVCSFIMQIYVSVFADADLSFYVCGCRSVFLVRSEFLLLLVQIHVSAFAGAKLCLYVCRYRSVFLRLQVQIRLSVFAGTDLCMAMLMQTCILPQQRFAVATLEL